MIETFCQTFWIAITVTIGVETSHKNMPKKEIIEIKCSWNCLRDSGLNILWNPVSVDILNWKLYTWFLSLQVNKLKINCLWRTLCLISLIVLTSILTILKLLFQTYRKDAQSVSREMPSHTRPRLWVAGDIKICWDEYKPEFYSYDRWLFGNFWNVFSLEMFY